MDERLINEQRLTRRRMFLLAAACLPLRASVDEFWNKKAPTEWTAQEIDRLITKSPWAKTVKATYAPGSMNAPDSGDIPAAASAAVAIPGAPQAGPGGRGAGSGFRGSEGSAFPGSGARGADTAMVAGRLRHTRESSGGKARGQFWMR